jgi:hypothetical protein
VLTCLLLAVLGFRLVSLSLSGLSQPLALSSVLLVFVIPPARVRCRLARQSGNVGRGFHSPGGSAMICGALIKPSSKVFAWVPDCLGMLDGKEIGVPSAGFEFGLVRKKC